VEIQVKHKGTFGREMFLSIPWEECVGDYEKSFKKLRRKIKLPGFRPGKVPKQVLVNQYQPLIEAEFLEHNIQSYYQRALKNEEIEPINKAEISDVEFNYGQTFIFKASFDVEPVINLPKLKKNKLHVVKPVYETDEEDISFAIEEFCRSHTKIETVEDGAKIDDFIICDLQETDFTGNPLIGRKIEKQYLKVGDPHLSEETNAALKGIKSGNMRPITMESGDKKSYYHVNVINVERHTLPEVNDEFVTQIDPEVSDVAAWKEKIREAITRRYEDSSEEQFSQHIIDAYIQYVNPEYPESMADAYLDSLVEDVKQSGDKVKDENKLREMFRPSAIRNLKYYLIRKMLVKDQNISVSSDEIDEEIQKRCKVNQDKANEISKYYRKPSNKKRLSDELIDRKITEFLKQFTKVKIETIKTADLRKKELEHTHEH